MRFFPSESEGLSGFQVIVLSHTDIRKDNRILKQIDAILKIDGASVIAIGVSHFDSTIPEVSVDFARVRIANLELRGFYRFLLRIRQSPVTSGNAIFLRVLRVLVKLPLVIPINFALFFRALKVADLSKLKVVVVNDDQPLLAASVLSALSESKVIYDSHELNHHRNGQTALERALVRQWERLFWSRVDFFITVSEAIRQHYLEAFGPKPSAVVLNSPRFSKELYEDHSIGDVRSVLGLDPDDLILLYAGAFAEGRGIRLLLEQASKLPNKHHLVFLGEGRLYPEIAGCSKTLARVHVLGPVPHDKVVPFVSSADFGLCLLEPVSLSDRLALPNKFFDYAFAGLPILYSDFPEMARVGRDFGLGEKCANSMGSILSAVSRMKGKRTVSDSLAALNWETQEKAIVGALNYLIFSP